ncbi:MAG: HEAT repeat domain-containing protein [Phycisphaerae bacterium]
MQIETALGASDHTVRKLAVLLLAERYGERSVPRIKQMLGDEHLQVRIATARELRKLGDEGGLDQMRVDWQSLLRPGGQEPHDALFQEANAAPLADLMDISLVLAESGDNRGYRLAELTALNGALEAQRYRAIWVLTEIARTSRERLAQHGLNPGAVLEKVAGSERSDLVQKQLLGAMSRFSKELDPALLARVIRALASSPHASEELRNRARELEKDLPGPPVEEKTDSD